jgi:hypothetical protein
LAGGVPSLRAGVPAGVYTQCVAGSATVDGVGDGVGVGAAVGVAVGVAAAAGVLLPLLPKTTHEPAASATTAQHTPTMMLTCRARWARWSRLACCLA